MAAGGVPLVSPRTPTERLLDVILAAAVIAGVWIESVLALNVTVPPPRPGREEDDDDFSGQLSEGWLHELGEHAATTSLLTVALVGLPAAIAVLMRRRWPLPAVVLSGVAALLGVFVFPVPVAAALAFAIVLYSVAVESGWLPAGIAAGAATVSIFVAAAVADLDDNLAAVLVALLATVVTPLLSASATRSRRAYLVEVEARLRQAEQEQQARTDQALAEDRVRLAHDLHDVLAHSLTVVNMQVGVASHLLADHPDRAAVALQEAQTAGATAISELRGTLSLLRGDLPEQLTPQPGLADLDSLFAGVAATGVPLTAHVQVGEAAVPAGVALVAYRVVQEGLTNVVKHAGAGAETSVSVVASDEQLRIDVTNGPGSPPPPSPPGIGLEGLRSRVTALGGTLRAGPTADGGFQLSAVIPLDSPTTGSEEHI